MSNKRRRRAEIGGYWLSRRDNSPNWCRTWFDPATRQTRRASLGTDDFQRAELKLAAWIAKNAEVRDQRPADLPLATVLTRYWYGHAKDLPSSVQAKIELRYWSNFFGADMVADLTPTRQEAFVEHLRGLGHSTSLHLAHPEHRACGYPSRAQARRAAGHAVHRRRRDIRGSTRQGSEGPAAHHRGDRGAVRCRGPASRVHVLAACLLHAGTPRSDP